MTQFYDLHTIYEGVTMLSIHSILNVMQLDHNKPLKPNCLISSIRSPLYFFLQLFHLFYPNKEEESEESIDADTAR